MNDHHALVQQTYKNLSIVWLGLISSLFMYLVLVLMVKVPTDASQMIMVIGVACTAVTIGMSGLLLRKFLARRGDSPEATCTRYKRAVVVALSFSEAVGLNGVVLHFLGASLQIVTVFFVSALICMLLVRPKLSELTELTSDSGRSSDGL